MLLLYLQNVNNIPVLIGTNFKKWKEHVMMVLSCMDLDLAIQKEPHATLTNTSTTQQMMYLDKCERSNRMNLMIMKHVILEP